MATTYDKASLVMIPSGYKDDKLYSIKPTNGSGDFTFSRDGAGASPATRVNASGLIEKGRENVLLQSNQFDTTWLSSGTTETGGQAGYDGTNDAWLLQRNDGLSRFVYQTTAFNSLTTFSVYAKAGNVDWVFLSSGVGENHYFDLANGVLGNTGTAIDASIEAVGATGWYRCSIVIANGSEVRIYPAVSDGGVSGLVGANIYIQDAQLEQGLVATDYIETTTAPVSAGLLGDMPRLDYSGGATCPSLLLEPSRVNIFAYSEYFGGWSAYGAGTGSTPVLTPNTNDTLSPEGLNNAYKIVFDAGSGTSTSDQSMIDTPTSGLTSGAAYTSTIWLKGAIGGEELIMRSVEGTYTKFTLTTEWAEYNVFENATATSYSCSLGIRQNVGHGILNSSATIYAYGAQCESGSYPTSYIPTYGSASTRGADDISSYDLPNFNNNSSFTMFFELNRKGVDSNEITYFARYRSNASSAMFNMWVDAPAAQVRFRDETSSNATMSTIPFAVGTTKKIAIVCNGTTFKTFVDGVLLNTYSLVNTFTIDKNKFDSKNLDFKQYLEFTSALTDAECIALTTI